MTPWLDDGDVRLYHGDALETVRQMPDESVDCVVTSPPYWGLRDYGTGEWDGGDPDCDHSRHVDYGKKNDTNHGAIRGGPMGQTCDKCGARRVDRQMGLEATPDLFVAGMVELFREIRRVLAPHGTCWINLGDSYAASMTSDRHFTQPTGADGTPATKHPPQFGGQRTAVGGLKPKDLVGAPWRVAFALQADGWWLRSDIIWAKPNPMPESVTDRPTKAHEYVFLLTKQPRYWFDTEAVREPHARIWDESNVGAGNWVNDPGIRKHKLRSGDTEGGGHYGLSEALPNPAGRNVRSVWQIATQPYPEAHFATYPEELARRCILAGCPIRVCRVCGKPSERIVERERVYDHTTTAVTSLRDRNDLNGGTEGHDVRHGPSVRTETVGWSDCGCGPLVDGGHVQGVTEVSKWRPGVVLDPFIGSGTTAKVARDHQRHAIGIDLNQTYLELSARRLQQLSLLTGFDQ